MELVLTFFAIMVVFFIGYMVGAKQMSKAMLDAIDNEFPIDQLLGDKEKALHIAGIKEASPKQIAEWQNDKRVIEETKTELSMEDLLSKFNPDDLKLKAGITPHDRNKGVEDLSNKMQSIVKSDDIDETELTKLRVRAAKKQAEMDLENRIKIDFESLNFSRISNDARKQITQIVKLDLEKKLAEASEVLPEVKEETKPKGKRKKTK